MLRHGADIIVIGAGIGGASVASECADSADVVLLERESSAGYHATGRSAAYFAPAYGNAVVRAITRVSEAFYRHPPADSFAAELLRPRDCIYVGRADQDGAMQSLRGEVPSLEEQLMQI